jgi:hypothetical protein
MRRISIFLILAAAVLVPTVGAQSSPSQATATAVCPTTATLDQLTAAIDAAISGPADKDRTCFRALFLPDTRLIPIRIAADGTAALRILTVDDWINAVSKRGGQVIYEHQLKVRTETWAHLAHLWSTYETGIASDAKSESKVMDRGINSIQAVYDGKQWHIIEIVWQAETPADPVPGKYLP